AARGRAGPARPACARGASWSSVRGVVHGAAHSIERNELHALRIDVAVAEIAANARDRADDLRQAAVAVDFGCARGTEDGDRPLAERERDVHRQRVAGHDHAAGIDVGDEVTNVVALLEDHDVEAVGPQGLDERGILHPSLPLPARVGAHLDSDAAWARRPW